MNNLMGHLMSHLLNRRLWSTGLAGLTLLSCGHQSPTSATRAAPVPVVANATASDVIQVPVELGDLATRISRYFVQGDGSLYNPRDSLSGYLEGVIESVRSTTNEENNGTDRDTQDQLFQSLIARPSLSISRAESRLEQEFVLALLASSTLRPIGLRWLQSVLSSTAAQLTPAQRLALLPIAQHSHRYLVAISNPETLRRERRRILVARDYEMPDEFAEGMGSRREQEFWFRRVHFNDAPASELAQFVAAIEAALNK